jgi:protein TonB
MTTGISSVKPLNPKVPGQQGPQNGNGRHFAANPAFWGWGGLVSLIVHGVVLAMPQHFFIPPPPTRPVSEIVLMVEVKPHRAASQAVQASEPEILPVAPLSPPPPAIPSMPEPEPEPPPPDPVTRPVLQPRVMRVLRPKTKPKPAVIPDPTLVARGDPPPENIPVPPIESAWQPPPSTTAALTLNTSTSADLHNEISMAPDPVETAADPALPVEIAFGSDEGPTFKQRVRTRYPRTAIRMGQEGTVVLRLAIGALGQLMDVEVVSSAGVTLDQAAIRAIRASTFHPATRQGRPVDSLALLPIRFKLKE